MAVKETQAEKIKRISKIRKNIRNICTSAHIHHGKCVAGDSRLTLADGSLKTAKELFEEISTNGEIFQENEEHTIFSPKEKIEIFSLNKDTGKIEKKEIQHAWRLLGGKTIKVKLRNGLEIETTPEHKYIVFENGAFIDKPACCLKLEDNIVCAKNIDYFWKEKNADKKDYDFIKVKMLSKDDRQLIQLMKNPFEDLAFVDIKEISEGFQDVVYDFTIPENHNFVAEGVIIHNTAMTDNLLAASGYMAAKYAGDLEQGMTTWQHSDEQERLLTVDAANVSMVHDFGGEEYLINLIDTPGHVDFSGNVTRAMRAIDGTIILVCAVEGIMPQTETVIKQALKERVRPVLFINKFDRLIKELKIEADAMQQRLIKIISDFNKLIERIAEPEFKEKWQVGINDGSVVFGSARDNWALSVPFMKKKGITFKDIRKLYDMNEDERKDWCWKNAPLYEVILDMVVKHLPNPLEAQKYRIPRIWQGDLDSQIGKDLLSCNPDGKTAFVITRVVIDPRAGKEIAAGRLFSGKLTEGMEVWLNLAKRKQRIQQVLVYNGIKPEQVQEIGAGNVLAISGISGDAGETVTLEEETPFIELKHLFEPVVTESIEGKKSADLPKLIEILRTVQKEDPTIKVEINEETGQHLISGLGELHLEIVTNRIRTEKGLDIITSPPIVVYRETVLKESRTAEGKSPNKHNVFFMEVEPVEDAVHEAIKSGEIAEGRIKKKNEILWNKLQSLGISNEEARQYRHIYKGCVLEDKTKGEVHIGEVIEMVADAFEQVIDAGPLAREPCIKIKVKLVDIKLHEDAIHRGPAQVYPAVRDAIRGAMQDARTVMYEPVQIIQLEAPLKYMGDITKLVQSKRGQLLDVKQEMDTSTIKAKMPVSEMIGMAGDLRGATEGRGSFSLVDQMFERMPTEIQEKVMRQIRSRKGLAENE